MGDMTLSELGEIAFVVGSGVPVGWFACGVAFFVLRKAGWIAVIACAVWLFVDLGMPGPTRFPFGVFVGAVWQAKVFHDSTD